MSSPNNNYTASGFYANLGGNAGNAQTYIGSYEPAMYIAHTTDDAALINQAFFNEGQPIIATTLNPIDPLFYSGRPVSWNFDGTTDPLVNAMPSSSANTPNAPSSLQQLSDFLLKYSSPAGFVASGAMTGGINGAQNSLVSIAAAPVVIVVGLILLAIAAYSIVIPKGTRSAIATTAAKSILS